MVTTGMATTGMVTTAMATTGMFTTGMVTTGVATTAVATTVVATTVVATTAVATTGATTGVATTGVVTTAMATTGVTNMKRQAMPTDYYLTTGMMLPNASDAPCGPYIILVSQTALNYVGAVEVAFALIQMVGLFTGLALAIWILVQAGKQRFRMGEEELGSKFAKQDYTGGGNDDDDDGMSDPPHSGDGKRKIVVNFGGN